jgi:hypothetical protein
MSQLPDRKVDMRAEGESVQSEWFHVEEKPQHTQPIQHKIADP